MAVSPVFLAPDRRGWNCADVSVLDFVNANLRHRYLLVDNIEKVSISTALSATRRNTTLGARSAGDNIFPVP